METEVFAITVETDFESNSPARSSILLILVPRTAHRTRAARTAGAGAIDVKC
jgi:hypothetical protein